MNTTKVTPINHILLHTKPHWDEIVAVAILQMYGEARYPGISTAKIRYTKGVEPRSDALFDGMKMLPVGCGHTRYDEHRADVERLPGECATTLVCKDLELVGIVALKRVAEETLRCDCEKGVQITEMPGLVKTMHRRLENGDEHVRNWVTKGLRAILTTSDLNLSSAPGEKTLKELFTKLDKEGHFPEKRGRDSLASIISKSQSRLEKAEDVSISPPIFELSYVVAALQRTDTIQPADIEDWVMFPLVHLYNDQVGFWEAVDEAKTPHRGRTAMRLEGVQGGKERAGVTVLVIQSDNPLIANASRTKKVGADVVVVRNNRGNIYVSVDAGTNLNLGNFIRMIRWLEIPKDRTGKPVDKNGISVTVSWNELGVEGQHKLAPHIYYFKNSILNGSTTHPDVAPVALCYDALCEIAQYAFDKNAITWMRKHMVPLPEKSDNGINHIGDALKNSPQADNTAEGNKKTA